MSPWSLASRAWGGIALAFALACPAPEPVPPPDPRPSILLITIDTLRADRLGTYGFPLDTSPQIDALAANGVVFERAIAAATTTAPAHASIMTSRYTREHSIGFSNGATRLRNVETLAEWLREAGYATGGFVGNIMLKPRTGFRQGFEHFDSDLPDAESNRELVFERIAGQTTELALDWLATTGSRPVFLWVHYQDPHGPYTPPAAHTNGLPESPDAEEETLPVLSGESGHGGIPAYQALPGLDRPSQYDRLYSGELHYADAWIGRLLEAFDNHESGREAIVLLTADHGESLGEQDHWFAHGFSTLPFLARVPFILRAPGIEPGRRSETVSHVDILPTLLELANLPVPADASGIALGPVLRGENSIPDRFVYSDIGRELTAYRGEKLIRITGTESAWLPANSEEVDADQIWFHYDWPRAGDVKTRPEGDDRPEAVVEYIQGAVPMSKTPAMELDQIEQLRALGYTVD